MPTLQQIPALLEALRSSDLLREPDDGGTRTQLQSHFGAEFIDASSNDYLGLARGTVSRETSTAAGQDDDLGPASEADGVSRETRSLPLGAGASRLVHGTHFGHLRTEAEVARWLGFPAGLLFSSGYAANVGALSALLDHNDLVVSDALNHASIIDGIRLSRARTEITPHRDLAAVERALAGPSNGAKWVVMETYYSMDGTSPPDLRALRALCDRARAHLYLDEAHAVGVFGPSGAGMAAAAGVSADVAMVAFGKAVGSHGAAIVSSREVRTWLWNRARSFVFSTAPSPVHATELHGQLVRAYAADEARARLLVASDRLRARLARAGLPLVPGSHGPIVGLVLGSAERALALARRAGEEGVLLQAIRPPTVPAGASRVRLTLTALLDEPSLERLGDVLIRCYQELA